MKARVKATGEIVEIIAIDEPYLFCSDGAHYGIESLEGIEHEIDYWTRLEHQYAGMAMQGMVSNSEMFIELGNAKGLSVENAIAEASIKIARAIVGKMKEE